MEVVHGIVQDFAQHILLLPVLVADDPYSLAAVQREVYQMEGQGVESTELVLEVGEFENFAAEYH